jgi:ketosteroid isomerase-like protein
MIRTTITAATALFVAVPAIAAEVNPSNCQAESTAYMTAFNKQDIPALLNIYTPDAVVVGPGGIIAGAEAVKAFLNDAFTNAKMTNEQGGVTKCYVESDKIKWATGDWKAQSPTADFGGVWTAFYVKSTDGNWRTRNLTYTAAPIDKK